MCASPNTSVLTTIAASYHSMAASRRPSWRKMQPIFDIVSASARSSLLTKERWTVRHLLNIAIAFPMAPFAN